MDIISIISDTPVCEREDDIVGEIGDNVTAVCMVDSFPPPTSYTWDITTSTHHYTVNTTVNTIQHALHTTHDYGTLSCTASNIAGVNISPCQVNIIPPTPPTPPTHCVVDNLTDNIISIQCLPGQQATLYRLHILDNNNTLLHNLSSSTPQFKLQGLHLPTHSHIVIYAENTSGRSDPVTLQKLSTKVAHLQIGNL